MMRASPTHPLDVCLFNCRQSNGQSSSWTECVPSVANGIFGIAAKTCRTVYRLPENQTLFSGLLGTRNTSDVHSVRETDVVSLNIRNDIANRSFARIARFHAVLFIVSLC